MSEAANIRDERRRRREKDRIRRRKRALMQRTMLGGVVLAIIILIIVSSVKALSKGKGENTAEELAGNEISENENTEGDLIAEEAAEETAEETAESESAVAEQQSGDSDGEITAVPAVSDKDYSIKASDSAVYMGSEEMTSAYGLLVNADDMTVVAAKNDTDRISPASMTKILTLLVACENITSPDDNYTVTIEATDYAYSNDCSSVGFSENEVVTVRDLLYGTILPSGGDAAYSLACYVAGSHEAFVAMMNDRLSQLGLSDSAHFTNCVGIYDADHYCTLQDMAVILAAAMDNELAREVLSAHRYTTSATEQHPDGIEISNLFLRRIEDKDTLGEVIGAKTGYVLQSGNCAASYYTGNDGVNYICVTANAHSAWRAIYDHVAVYNIYAAKNTGYHK